MLRKIFIRLMIAIALAYGGVKLYAAHSISKTADKMIRMLSPVAEIKYQGTTSSLDGMVGLTGVTVHVLKDNGVYRIGAVKLKSDNLLTLLEMSGELEKGEVPKTFGIELQKLTVPMTAQVLNKSHGNLGVLGFMHMPIGSLPCGKQSNFSTSDLEHMGIDHITVNVNTEVRREPEKDDIRITSAVDIPGINAADIDLRFAAANGTLNPRTMRSLSALESVSLKVRDQGWHKRVQDFCAKRTGMTRKAWLAAHIGAVKVALARRGISVGANLLGAYRSFLKNDGTMTLSMAPQDHIDLRTLRLYSIQNAMYYLAPTLTVNGKQIAKLDLASIEPEGTPAPKESVAAIPSNGKQYQYNYRTIPLNTLDRHVGEHVRLTTDSQHVFAGKLESVGGRIATVNVKGYYESNKEIVLLTRVAKTEVATSLKRAKSGAL